MENNLRSNLGKRKWHRLIMMITDENMVIIEQMSLDEAIQFYDPMWDQLIEQDVSG